MLLQGSRRRLARTLQQGIVISRVLFGAGRDTGVLDAQMIVLFEVEYVSTCWALWRESVTLELGQKFTKFECSGKEVHVPYLRSVAGYQIS